MRVDRIDTVALPFSTKSPPPFFFFSPLPEAEPPQKLVVVDKEHKDRMAPHSGSPRDPFPSSFLRRKTGPGTDTAGAGESERHSTAHDLPPHGHLSSSLLPFTAAAEGMRYAGEGPT